MFTTLQDAIVQTVMLGAPSILASRELCYECYECLQYGDFFIRHFLFHGRKEVFPMSTQQYYNFQNLLIVELLNYLIFLNK